MADYADQKETITAEIFAGMLDAGLNDLWEIIQAQVGDKTIIDTLVPARDAFRRAIIAGKDFHISIAGIQESVRIRYAVDPRLVANSADPADWVCVRVEY